MFNRSTRAPTRHAQKLLMLFVAALFSACAMNSKLSDSDLQARYKAAVDNPIRSDQDRELDGARHPIDFLTFAQLRPGMRVLDVSTGAGYTTQLEALVVGPGGIVYAQAQKPGQAVTKRMADHPQENIKVIAQPFQDPVPPGVGGLDLETIVLNYHDITYQPVDRAAMNARLFAALHPGGHLVIVDHSPRAGTGVSDGHTLHRVDEAVVKSELAAAGFQLEAESDLWRNPADARDQISAGGPVVSDKFALRFVKP